jgi:glutamate synthase (NADPH/NADH) small chain
MTEEKNTLQQIMAGTELSAYCPQCKQGMNLVRAEDKKTWVKMRASVNGSQGHLYVSPRLEKFDRTTDLDIKEKELFSDLGCPHCSASLIAPEEHCSDCGAAVVSFTISVQAKLIPFKVCSRSDCRWYSISKADETRIKPKIGRQTKPEQDPQLRVHNFLEVAYGFTRELAMMEAERCLDCKKPFCVDGCPVSIDIPAFIQLIKAGKFVEAARKIKEKNALPAVCGRVCPQEEQCEKLCVLGKKGEPVAIGNLERFAADYERETNAITIPQKAPATGFRIAVVGSGPAGLTMAADMAVKGHEVTVFEALHQTGGVLVYGIPEFRLPKAIVQSEVNYLSRLGVKIEVNAIIGSLYSIEDLFEEGFDAVYVATGAGLPVFMKMEGENLCNILSANEYLTRVNLMKAYRFPEYDTPAPVGKRVAVIGGGNVAMDCARTALRMGSDEVIVVYRRNREAMPARDEEIHHAEEEGIIFKFLTNPVRYIGTDRGWVKQLECIQMKLGEADSSGRARPVPIPDSNFILDVDMAIVAVGAGPNPVLFSGCPDLERNPKGYIRAYNEAGRTSIPRVWAGGDIVTGSATVILAMGAARSAANDMHDYLSKGSKEWATE